ncbi:MAG: prolyl oligopeptidase family serine peptidase [Bacteroidales bacterium]
MEKIKPAPYPETRKVDTVDDYFGTPVADPYRWLEDDNSPETAEWVKAQNEVTFGYLEQIPFRSSIRKRLEQIWDYPKYGAPFREGEYYYFFKNDGMQNQSVLYRVKELGDEPELFFDPNALSEDGTVALSSFSFSKDGRLFGYSISRSGSDWSEIFVRDAVTGTDLEDHLEWVKFSGISWFGDGFFYSRYDKPAEGDELSAANKNHKVFYHKIGQPQQMDVLVYKNDENPNRMYWAQTTEDESWLILNESEGTSGNALWVRKTSDPEGDFILLAEGFDNEYGVVDNIGDFLLVRTNLDAPRWRLVLVNPSQPQPENWKEIIPESDNVLESVALAGSRIMAGYLKNATSVVQVFDLDGKYLYDVDLPGIGSLSGFSARMEDNEAFYGFTSFTFPTTIYHYDVNGNKSEVLFAPEIDFDVNAYETHQVFYKSKDGTEVPMFIVHRKGLKKNGKNPTYLYGYGGFNISLTPNFSITRLILLENGFVFAMPNLRGGGEFGEEWHEAGTKMKKQNVFDDFIAAADYLINEGYTSPAHLAIAGGSNGGLLVGATMTQRPDLFAVALPAVGVMDMLRYHLFTIGWAWASDYGRSDDSEEMFRYLYSYSPLHNIREGVSYPATLITTADHDDRVVPAHSFKFAATLQEKQAGDKPVLIRIDVKAGHGGGKPTAKIIDEYTDVWSFLFYNLGVEPNYDFED